MTKTEESLVGKTVSLYLEGGWEVSGVVRSVSDSKIVVEHEMTDELFLVFKDKVSCLRIESAQKKSVPDNKSIFNANIKKKEESLGYDDFPMNKVGYDDSGMSIPLGMLENIPEDDDDDFSMTLGKSSDGELNDKKGHLEFRIDNDSKKED
jgi:sRNA-binding regulator protein Hfq